MFLNESLYKKIFLFVLFFIIDEPKPVTLAIILYLKKKINVTKNIWFNIKT